MNNGIPMTLFCELLMGPRVTVLRNLFGLYIVIGKAPNLMICLGCKANFEKQPRPRSRNMPAGSAAAPLKTSMLCTMCGLSMTTSRSPSTPCCDKVTDDLGRGMVKERSRDGLEMMKAKVEKAETREKE
jgi:hypothetical protein